MPSPEAPAGKPIHVTLEEWAVIPAYSSAPAGRIRFEAQNQGGASHMFVVVRTADPARHLGVSGDTANLAASGKVMARVPPFPSGDTRTVDVRLSPGHYVLLCNVPAHYMAGMRADFTVR